MEIPWHNRAIYVVTERLGEAVTGPAIDALDLAEELVEMVKSIEADYTATN